MAKKKVKVGELIFQIVIFLIAVFILVFAFVPIFLMIVLSLKDQVQIYGNFWSWPNPVDWDNYSIAFNTLLPNMINSFDRCGGWSYRRCAPGGELWLCVCEVGLPW